VEYRYTNWVVRLREDSKPRTLVLELTTACNYSCIHCFRFASRDFKVTFMDEELYHRIVKEAKDIGVGRIVYTGWGEPTVHPRFMEFLEVAKKLGFEVVVNTNGSRLEELAVSFVKLGVDEVYISIDAFDIKLYSSIRRFGDLSTVTRGLLTLRKVKTEISSLKPTVKAILTVTKVNVGEISRILDYAVTPSPHPQEALRLPRAVCRISARKRTPHPSYRIPHSWGITFQGRGASAPVGPSDLLPTPGFSIIIVLTEP
jgi:MoaA/NifB/PqqE/SkfB family radical SAM enzyme